MDKEKTEIIFEAYNDYEVITGTCNHTFPLHIHQSLCVGTITKGSVHFVCDRNESILKAGEAYCIPPGSPHAFTPINSNAYSYRTVCLRNKTFTTSNFTAPMAQAIWYIDHADLSALCVEAVCNFVHVSKFHFIRTFKNEVGITPYQFILNQKIKKIRQGICTSQSLSDLALTHGFSDQSHLCHTFKKYMGVTPLQFRTKHSVHHSSAGENFAKM